jgi:hypothetical protein
MVAAAPSAQAVPTGSTTLIDRPAGFGALPFDGQGDTKVWRHSLSADGCFVVFESESDDLLATDEDSARNVYRQDRCTADTKPVQINTTAAGAPAQAGSDSSDPTISTDGRYVAFSTGATNLDPAASELRKQVMVKDMSTGALELVSRGDGAAGAAAEEPLGGVISGDGNAVAFLAAGALDAANVDGDSDVHLYVRFRSGASTLMASLTTAGSAATASGPEDISFDGQNIAFVTSAVLDPADTDAGRDVYLRQSITSPEEATRLVSFSGGGQPVEADSGGDVAISAFDNVIAYTTTRTFVTSCPTTCTVAAIADNPRPGGSVADDSFSPYFAPRASGSPAQVFWHTAGRLDPAADANQAADVYRAPLGKGGIGTVALVTGGVANGDILGANSTDDLAATVFWTRATTNLPGSDGQTAAAFERVGGVTRNLHELAGLTPQAHGAGDARIGSLHAVSRDGRVVVFGSLAPGLGALQPPLGEQPIAQIFARDVASGATTLVSVGVNGTSPQDGAASDDRASVDDSGAKVAFASRATNLVAEPTGGDEHVYIRDLTGHVTKLVDRTAADTPIAGGASRPQLSGDGKKVVFLSESPDLEGASSGVTHAYSADIASGEIELVDRAPGGAPADGDAGAADPSFDGARVAFASVAGNLGGPAGASSVYVRDLEAGTTTVASVLTTEPTDEGAQDPSLSSDGTRVAFSANGFTPEPHVYTYVRDLAAGTTSLASSTATPNDFVRFPSLSDDGTRVAFTQNGGAFVRDLAQPQPQRIDLRDGVAAPGALPASAVSLSGNGRCGVFLSRSGDLVTLSYGPDDDHVYLRAVDAACPAAAVAKPPLAPETAKDRTAPRIGRARLTRKRFALGRGRTPRSAGRQAGRGTTFVFNLSEAATTRIVIERALPGRRRGRSCVKPRKGLRRHCIRYLKSATLIRSKTRQGLNRVAFSGRVGKKALRRGKYRATLTATDRAGNRSRPARVGFTVVRR